IPKNKRGRGRPSLKKPHVIIDPIQILNIRKCSDYVVIVRLVIHEYYQSKQFKDRSFKLRISYTSNDQKNMYSFTIYSNEFKTFEKPQKTIEHYSTTNVHFLE